jgi:hypothetical protein
MNNINNSLTIIPNSKINKNNPDQLIQSSINNTINNKIIQLIIIKIIQIKNRYKIAIQKQ